MSHTVTCGGPLPSSHEIPDFTGVNAYPEALHTLLTNPFLGLVVVRACVDTSAFEGMVQMLNPDDVLPKDIEDESHKVLDTWWKKHGYDDTAVSHLGRSSIQSLGFRPQSSYANKYAAFNVVSLFRSQIVYAQPTITSLRDETTGLRSTDAKKRYNTDFDNTIARLDKSSSDLQYSRVLSQHTTINAGDIAIAKGQPAPSIIAVHSLRKPNAALFATPGFELIPVLDPTKQDESR